MLSKEQKLEAIEEWRFVPGYENRYQVSDMGRVRSVDRVITTKYSSYVKMGKIMSPGLSPNGYLKVTFYPKNTYSVHRLVASAFLGLSLESFYSHKYSDCVCHKNDVRHDNRLQNLFIGKTIDNIHDMWEKGRSVNKKGSEHGMFGKKGFLNATSKKVIQYSLGGELIEVFGSQRIASEKTGVSQSDISRCCRGIRKNAGGYLWSFNY